jgi:hypothetical protein
MASIAIQSVAPSIVSSGGGDAVAIAINVVGPSLVGAALEVRLGGVLVYGGQGIGYAATLAADNTVAVITPPLEEGLHDVFVKAIVATHEDTLVNGLTVLKRHFGSASFEMRRMFSRWHGVGPRSLELEE